MNTRVRKLILSLSLLLAFASFCTPPPAAAQVVIAVGRHPHRHYHHRHWHHRGYRRY